MMITGIFPAHSGMKLEKSIIRKKSRKNTNIRTLNNMLLNKESVNQEIKEEIQKYMETNEMKIQWSKIIEMQQKKF